MAGARVTDAARDRFWGRYSGYFQDPDGRLWEIAWNPAWEIKEEQLNTRDAVALIREAIPQRGGTWVDLGAGDGTFTRALVDLLWPSRVYAVDRDARAVATIKRWATREAVGVIPVRADFSRPFDLPGANGAMLDGMLLANSLHFVPDPDRVLARLAAWLRPGGRVVLVEYDRRRASPWVPYPIPSAQWPVLAASAGLSTPVITARRPSAFGGDLYVAAADLPATATVPLHRRPDHREREEER